MKDKKNIYQTIDFWEGYDNSRLEIPKCRLWKWVWIVAIVFGISVGWLLYRINAFEGCQITNIIKGVEEVIIKTK
jgi:hypothetical protein